MAYTENRYGREKAPGMSGTRQLLLVNLLFFILVNLSEWQDKYGQFHSLRDWLGLIPAQAFYQPWRWLTYMFVHADFGHFLFNMWGLLIFGPVLEFAVGRARMLAAYFLCGLIGAGLWFVFNLGAPANLMGASAAVVGYLVSAAILFPHERIRLLFPPIELSMRTFALVLVGIDALMLFNSGGRVAHLAHLGGAFGAIILFRNVLQAHVKQAGRQAKFSAPVVTTHTCAQCGVTDVGDPQMDFRVCSGCSGGLEYCENHLRAHQHRQADQP